MAAITPYQPFCKIWLELSSLAVANKKLTLAQCWTKLLANKDRDWGKIKRALESKPEKLEEYRIRFGQCFEIAIGNLHELISKLQDHPSTSIQELNKLMSKPAHILRHCRSCSCPTIVAIATSEKLVTYVEKAKPKCDEKAIFKKVGKEIERAIIFQTILNALPQKV